MTRRYIDDRHNYEYAVRGRGEFPFRLLWKDRAWPATEADAVKLYHRGERTIRLRSLRQPVPEWWAADGWEVVR